MIMISEKERMGSGIKEKKAANQPDEVVAFCPCCKALETVWINGDSLLSTRKFTQIGSLVYHNCGSKHPCYLYYSG